MWTAEVSGPEEWHWTAATRAFAQILGKFYFFDLLENLRLILFDYGQKAPYPANTAFNAAC
jgi:hypothetical protein